MAFEIKVPFPSSYAITWGNLFFAVIRMSASFNSFLRQGVLKTYYNLVSFVWFLRQLPCQTELQIMTLKRSLSKFWLRKNPGYGGLQNELQERCQMLLFILFTGIISTHINDRKDIMTNWTDYTLSINYTIKTLRNVYWTNKRVFVIHFNYIQFFQKQCYKPGKVWDACCLFRAHVENAFHLVFVLCPVAKICYWISSGRRFVLLYIRSKLRDSFSVALSSNSILFIININH